jgi:hypothetical protein
LPYRQVEIYRAGSEIVGFDDPKMEIIANARALEPTHVNPLAELAQQIWPFDARVLHRR